MKLQHPTAKLSAQTTIDAGMTGFTAHAYIVTDSRGLFSTHIYFAQAEFYSGFTFIIWRDRDLLWHGWCLQTAKLFSAKSLAELAKGFTS